MRVISAPLPALPLQQYRSLPPQQRVAHIITASLLPESAADDHWTVFALVAAAAAAGRGCSGTAIGRTLSAPICAMAVTFVLTAAGVLPAATPVVSEAQSLAVHLATPLLLLDADLRAIGRRASQLVPAFLLGTLGTIAGTIAGIVLLRTPLWSALGPDGLKTACALAAKNIGGGLNFVAVAAALGVSPVAFTTALAVDNVMALVYFPLVSTLGRGLPDVPTAPGGVAGDAASVDPPRGLDVRPAVVAADDGKQGGALAVGLLMMALSRRMAARWLHGFDLPIVTILTVAAATLAPRWLGPLASRATELGTTCIFLFFATAGWTGGSVGAATMLNGGPVLLTPGRALRGPPRRHTWVWDPRSTCAAWVLTSPGMHSHAAASRGVKCQHRRPCDCERAGHGERMAFVGDSFAARRQRRIRHRDAHRCLAVLDLPRPRVLTDPRYILSAVPVQALRTTGTGSPQHRYILSAAPVQALRSTGTYSPQYRHRLSAAPVHTLRSTGTGSPQCASPRVACAVCLIARGR